MRFARITAVSVLITAFLTGCSTTSGLEATQTVSGFDGSTTVDMPEHGTACGSLGSPCLGLGFQWSSKSPSSVIVKAAYFNEFKAITRAQLSIDGRIVELVPLPGLTRFSRLGDPVRMSEADFSAPIDVLRAAASSSRVWLRINTTAGYAEDVVVDGTQDSKALHALKRFLAKVDASTGH